MRRNSLLISNLVRPLFLYLRAPLTISLRWRGPSNPSVHVSRLRATASQLVTDFKRRLNPLYVSGITTSVAWLQLKPFVFAELD